MKVAIAYFGIPRNSPICFPSIEGNIYSRLPSFCEVRSFYHLYEPQLVSNPRSGENNYMGGDNYRVFSAMTGRIDPPGHCLKRWAIDDFKQYGDVWGDGFKSLENLLHQLNSLHEVTSMVEPYEPDVVMYLRPDLLYLDALPAFVLPAVFARSHAAYIPNWQWWNGLNDRFSVCGRDVYRAYGKRVETALEFCREQQRGLHAERLLRFAMANAGAKLRTLDMRASRVRVAGAIVEESFSPSRSMGRRENRFALPLARLRSRVDSLLYAPAAKDSGIK